MNGQVFTSINIDVDSNLEKNYKWFFNLAFSHFYRQNEFIAHPDILPSKTVPDL